MIVPERTKCPSPRFTPRRLPALSRPFLLDEPAFLCAMNQSSDSAFFGVRRRGADFGFSSVPAAFAARVFGFAADAAFAWVVFGFSAAAVRRVGFGFSAASGSALEGSASAGWPFARRDVVAMSSMR